MSAVTTVPAAGWYEDDMVPGRERWWDGDRWSDRVRRSEFALDCWVSEQHRARAGAVVARHDGGARWTEASSVGAGVADEHGGLTLELGESATWALLGHASDLISEDGGLEACEIGPIQVTVVADQADRARTAAAPQPGRGSSSARGRNSTRKSGGKKKSNRRPSEAAAAAVLATRLYDQDEDAAPVATGAAAGTDSTAIEPVCTVEPVPWVEPDPTPEPVKSATDITTDSTTESLMDAGSWGDTPLASIDGAADWSATTDAPSATDATVDAWADTPAVSAARDDTARRPKAQPLADAAAVIAALAAISAPVGHVRTGASSNVSGNGGPMTPMPADRVTSASADRSALGEPAAESTKASMIEEPAAKVAVTVETATTSADPQSSDAASSNGTTSRRRGVPPRPTLAPTGESGEGPTSNTFTRIDRKTLDAAMALSAVVGPATPARPAAKATPAASSAGRPTGTAAAAQASPVAPVAPTEPEKVATPRTPRPIRSNRPAPPLPRWNDNQAADDDADSGFVRISTRDGKKRVLGK